MPPGAGRKSTGAFRTIGEVVETTGIAPHVLRYWESKFTQLRPLTRAGNRRYYRPEDVALVVRIQGLLEREGYTIRGVQTLLTNEAGALTHEDRDAALRAVRDALSQALAGD